MTAVSGIGYALIALGPALAFFVIVIAPKPFLVLTLLTSALVWLISLVGIASIWRGFLPLGSSVWPYIPLLTSAVLLQEIIRFFFWRTFKRIEEYLDAFAAKISKPRLSYADKTQIALAIGLGHGVAHSLFFCISLLTPAFGPATFYIATCSRLPLFLLIAMSSLVLLIIHTFSMVIAFNGYSHKNRKHQAFPPLIHLLAAYLSTLNLMGWCGGGISSLVACAAISIVLCGKIMWDKTA